MPPVLTDDQRCRLKTAVEPLLTAKFESEDSCKAQIGEIVMATLGLMKTKRTATLTEMVYTDLIYVRLRLSLQRTMLELRDAFDTLRRSKVCCRKCAGSIVECHCADPDLYVPK